MAKRVKHSTINTVNLWLRESNLFRSGFSEKPTAGLKSLRHKTLAP